VTLLDQMAAEPCGEPPRKREREANAAAAPPQDNLAPDYGPDHGANETNTY
jgi:hypothetical protein